MQVAQTGTSSGQASPAAGGSWHLWANGSFSFHDVLDAINPLQHLPVVSTIYRAVTGDTIGNAARVAGDALYGGVAGLALGVANAVSVSDTGKDLGQRVMAMVEGDAKADAGTAASPKGTVTVEPVPSSTPNNTPASTAKPSQNAPQNIPLNTPQADAAQPQISSNAAAGKTISMQAALASLPDNPPVDLPFFPGGTAAPAVTAQGQAPGADLARLPTPASPPSLPIQAPAPIKLASAVHGIAIDTSDEGILAMRSKHGPAAIPLQASPGAFLAQTAAIAGSHAASSDAQPVGAQASLSSQKSDNSNDFVIRMRQGIEKYNALLAKQNGTGNAGNNRVPTTVDTPSIADTTDVARLLN